ncbi:MAG: bi-domain-containing oxidoreductase [Rhodospirillales bacterium]
MKQVIQSARTGKLALKEVPPPQVKAGYLLVQTRASLISAGTDRLITEFARKSMLGKAKARPDLVKKILGKLRRDGIAETVKAVMARLDEPLPLGYSASGTVVAVGAGLEGRFRVGERVAVAGAGLANHAEMNVVPKNLAVPVPKNVPDEEACFATLGAIALHAVRNADAKLGERVAVLGLGLVGQLACQFLTLSGARVVALDFDAERVDLARRLGAELPLQLSGATAERVMNWSHGLGVDGVIVAAATDSSEPFDTAAAIARDRARVVLVGKTGTEFSYRDFMQKELTIIVSRSYGPGRYDADYEQRGVDYPEGYVRWTETANLAECVRLMAPENAHRLDVKPLITHRYAFEHAEAAYDLVTSGREPHLGVVLNYADKPTGTSTDKAPKAFPHPKIAAAEDKCVIGMIGAGNFARAQLLPALKKSNHVSLHTLISERGASAEHTQDTFGFAHAGTDEADVLANPAINAVVIATRHDNHAALTVKALKANKAVLVEKPLALTHEDLNAVAAARNESKAFFQVGFNRRFAPLSIAMRDFLSRHDGAKFVLIRVNTGALPADHWIHSAEEGGGRLLGEACHFVDLARFLIKAPVESVQANAPRGGTVPCEDAAITLRFADGSLAAIAYTARGDTVFSKERIEAYAGGAVMAIDDFREGILVEQGRSKRVDAAAGKGVGAEVAAFVDAVIANGAAPIDEAELIETGRATIAVLESLRSGAAVDL